MEYSSNYFVVKGIQECKISPFYRVRFTEIAKYEFTLVLGTTKVKSHTKLNVLMALVTFFILILISIVLSSRKLMHDPRYLNSVANRIKPLLLLIVSLCISGAIMHIRVRSMFQVGFIILLVIDKFKLVIYSELLI